MFEPPGAGGGDMTPPAIAVRGLRCAYDGTGRAALDGVDRRILSLSSRSIAGFLLQGLIRGIENDAASRSGAADGASPSAGVP